MTFSQTGVSRLRYSIEPNGSYSLDRTGTIANFADIRHMEAPPKLAAEMVPDASNVQRYWQRTNDQVGFDRPTIDLKSYFVGSGLTLNAAGTTTKTKQMELFESIFGGYSSGAGSLVVASPSPTTTSFSVTTGQGTRFTAGDVIWVLVGGNYEVTRVATVTTDALTLAWALSAAPATGAVVLGSLRAWLEEPFVAQTSIQLLWEAASNRDLIFLLLGMQAASFTLDLGFGTADATWTASLAGNRWLHDSAIATPQGGSAIAAATYDGAPPTRMLKGQVLFGPAAATTRTLYKASKFSVTPNVKHVPIVAPTLDGSGIVQMWRDRGDAPTFEMEFPSESTTLKTLRAAQRSQTLYKALAFGGSGPGDLRAVDCPTVQILDVQETPVNGLRGVAVTAKCIEDQTSTDLSTSYRRSPLRVVIS